MDKDSMLGKIRALLTKAEDTGVTEAEAEALRDKAAELMAKYGIDRARLAALRPETDRLTDKLFAMPNPWARVNSHLLARVAAAMRCQTIQLNSDGSTIRRHVFGYASDIERAEILYTSLLLQMANGLARQAVPGYGAQAKAWRRSWMLGFISEVGRRLAAAEKRAADQADAGDGPGTALVLADRSVAVLGALKREYPQTRSIKLRYSGHGFEAGKAAGRTADIGGARVGSAAQQALR